MANRKKIQLTFISLLAILLLCECSVAGPTLSLTRTEKQSDNANLSGSDFTNLSVERSIGTTPTSFYRDLSMETVTSSAETIRINETAFSTKSNDVQYWAASPKNGNSTPSEWSRLELPDDLSGPNFPGKGPKYPVTLPDKAKRSPTASAPTPAAITLGCIGLMFVGWLRDRKTP